MLSLKRTQLFISILLIVFFQACSDGVSEKPPIADTPVLINRQQLPVGNSKNTYADVDLSPMDMSYYPPNYPQLKMADPSLGQPVLRVIYSRPHLQGRVLFQDILKYNEPWRLGANEATELQVFQTVTVDGNRLNKGRYSLHCTPREKEWTVSFNSANDIWGLKFDASKDLFKVAAPATHGNPSIEYFTMVFEKSETGANLIMAWGDVVAKLPFSF